MGQIIQKWTKWNLWKAALKKFKVIWTFYLIPVDIYLLKVYNRSRFSIVSFQHVIPAGKYSSTLLFYDNVEKWRTYYKNLAV